MPSQYATIQHEWFDRLWNNGDETAIDELLHPECTGHGLADNEGNEVRGIESFRAFYHNFRSAFPDIHVEIEEYVASGDLISVYCRCTATHSGQGFVLPATNRKVDFTGQNMIRIKDGLIFESWNSFDFLKVMQQIGVFSI